MSGNTRTRVTDTDGRLVAERVFTEGGEVDSWIELPSSLKQPLMAMVAEVGNGVRETVDFPVPGGDTLIIHRTDYDGLKYGVHLKREPLGFPPEGRDLRVDAAEMALFLQQVRSV